MAVIGVMNTTTKRKVKMKLEVNRIDYKTAMRVIIDKHYLHRKAPCSFAFGVFDNDILLGVICYGTPSSAPLRSGICGKEEAKNVIELTRLWVDDVLPKNTESWLIAQTLKLIDKEIVVSFADTKQNHVGVIYQATNWIYTGLSAKHTDWTIAGISLHGQTIADKHTAKQIRKIYGDRFSLKERSRKHRYVYFNGSRKRKKQLLQKLRYPIFPYPKLLRGKSQERDAQSTEKASCNSMAPL